jgi:hypothetical protein
VTQPFAASEAEILAEPGRYVDAVIDSIESAFLVMPRGDGFIEYARFQAAYEVLKRHTTSFEVFEADAVHAAVIEDPLAFVVVRTILGFTPPEWAEVTTERTGVCVSQSAARGLDRRIRIDPAAALGQAAPKRAMVVKAMVRAACEAVAEGPSLTADEFIHRLDKVDTNGGSQAVAYLADNHVPYAVLLYERLLGRPFAGHRDSISELVGDPIEAAIESLLANHGITYRRIGRAERIRGFDQAPDFLIPDEFAPVVVIEAKLANDDGTARDKVTRIQHLDRISQVQYAKNGVGFQVVACVGGRGFKVRREDMRKIIEATKGKVYTPTTLDHMIETTELARFVSR